MQWSGSNGGAERAPSRTERVRKDTGLGELAQTRRAVRARMWAARVLELARVCGCDIRLALRAVEDSDRERK